MCMNYIRRPDQKIQVKPSNSPPQEPEKETQHKPKRRRILQELRSLDKPEKLNTRYLQQCKEHFFHIWLDCFSIGQHTTFEIEELLVEVRYFLQTIDSTR